MARPLRIQQAGLTYHVTSRGNARADIFTDDEERRFFLARLAEAVDEFRLECHDYCLMGNHYHLIVRTLRPNISRTMRHINGTYAQWWNQRHERVGHVFQARFGSEIIEDDSYLLTASRYVARNPVAAKLVDRPQDWPWSSYAATAGFVAPPDFLSRACVRFFGTNREAACLGYRSFVEGPLAIPEELAVRPVQGTEVFKMTLDVPDPVSREVPREDRNAVRPSLGTFFAGAVTRARREQAVVEAYRLGYTMVEVADHLGLHYTTVSRIISRHRRKPGG